jgi:HK97 family phage major capsid protein
MRVWHVEEARGARGVLVESVALADLASDYATKLDAQVLYGTGNSGQHTGLLTLSGTNSVTYTDASPTLAELWPKLADAVGRVMSSRFTGPTAIAMRPNVWAWLLSSLGTDNRPLINAGESGPLNALGTSTSTDYAASAVGQILGVPVVLDGNIPANLGTGTNETAIIAADFRDVILFEDNGGEPVQLRFDSVGSANLTVRLQVYGYTALAAGRQPAAVSKITGTGLIVPSL